MSSITVLYGQMNSGEKYQIDMCHGPLFAKIVKFSIPLMVANITQFLFNAVDLVVIGRYASYDAMAAVGSCGPLISMILSVFFGLSVGANVMVARHIGANDRTRIHRSVHTAMSIALYGGIVLAVIGGAVSKPVLVLMSPPRDVLCKATLYMRLYCACIPFILIYNFGSSILRATGDTRRPLAYMLAAGIMKTLLNLFFVRTLHWDVGGVAAATLVANFVSASMVFRALTDMRDGCRLYWRKLRIYWTSLIDNLKIGIPAGVQGSLFGLSNVIIQSTVNSFGAQAMAGTAAAVSLESIVFVAFISYYYSVISFVGQNHGAKKYKRIVKCVFHCLLLAVLTSSLIGMTICCFDTELLSIYNPDPEVIRWGVIRLKYLAMLYFLCAIMEVLNGALRGLGHSLIPMIVTMLGACVFRVFWVLCIFPLHPTMDNLLISYPVSWILVSAVNTIILYRICRRMFRDAAHRRKMVADCR